ncbi:MAG: methylenetetrahydrofolate reductase [Phycisphaerales bacterium]|nr:MAG: methylenetetrahydrofolate reductase [Phycisphaerales bacterium]
MKVTDIWNSRQKPTISFELFPPRSPKGAESLGKAIDALAALEPDFVSVTFGAGGSTREGSRQLVQKLKNEKNLEVLAYFACYGLGPEDITAVLDSYQALGVENVLAVRGDLPRDQEDFKPHPESLSHASDLLAFIRPRYGFCLGAAGYPEGHIDCESKDKDIEYLKLKVGSGAEYIISNYFYDNKYFFDFVQRCTAIGIDVPIVPGVMPIYSVKMLEMLAGLCGATITYEVRQGIASVPEGDKEALVDFGIEFAARQCKELLEAAVPGLHFYTMDRSKSVAGIVSRLRYDGVL